MSAMDQAFIKAYAKDALPPAAEAASPAQSAASAGPPSRAGRASAVATHSSKSSHLIDQIYHDGALYRLELPTATAPCTPAVPAPHFELPPRTSPRRNVRRSMLKLMGQEPSAAAPPAIESPKRRQTQSLAQIARRLAPPSLPPVPAAPASGHRKRPHGAPAQELPPEVVIDYPGTIEPLPMATPATAPQLPPAPHFIPQSSVAPLNLADEFAPQFEVQGHWDGDAVAGLGALAPGALVVLPEPADLSIAEPASLVELKLDALPLPVEALPEERNLRLDPPHAAAVGKSHLKLTPASESPAAQSPAAQTPPEIPAADLPDTATAYFGPVQEEEAHEDHAPAAEQAPQPEKELEFADAESEPVETSASAVAAAPPAQAAAPSIQALRPSPDDCLPVWEVDRIQWPVAVERLVADKDGYFAQASGRLLAAVRDGLRTLAISGSRRGEGRTTLALCLARAAGRAGISVAVIDADFARPQLAARIGLDVNHGWQDAATGLVPLSETAVRSLADNVTILPLEGSAARTGLSLADPRVTATLRAAAATFDLVIIDLGPLAAGDEPLFPAGEKCPLDAAIVVRDLRYASAAESEAVGERLMAAGVEAVGIAENFVIDDEIPVTSV